MRTNTMIGRLVLSVASLMLCPLTVLSAVGDVDSLAEQLANPVASLISVPIQYNKAGDA